MNKILEKIDDAVITVKFKLGELMSRFVSVDSLAFILSGYLYGIDGDKIEFKLVRPCDEYPNGCVTTKGTFYKENN